MSGVNRQRKHEKKATVLKIVSGKQPLHDSTSAILNRPPVEPEPSQSTLEVATEEDNVPDPLAAITVEESPLRSLCGELNRVLDNKKALFSLMSKLIGDVAKFEEPSTTFE